MSDSPIEEQDKEQLAKRSDSVFACVTQWTSTVRCAWASTPTESC